MAGRVLVAGIGNIFYSDDGFGCEVVRRLAQYEDLPAYVTVVDYGIRGMHLAYDLLDGYEALILIDAIPGQGAPGDITVLEIGGGEVGSGGFDPHGMAPVAMLAGVRQLGGALPPTYLVGCQPESVGDGIGLSEPVSAAVPGAVAAVRALLSERVAV